MKVLITGAGQDSSLTAYLHLVRGDQVYVLTRRRADGLTGQMRKVIEIANKSPEFIYADLTEYEKVFNIVQELKPNMIYHYGAMSFVPYSYENPIYTNEVNYLSAYAILEAVRKHSPETKVFLPSSSEVFGHPLEYPQTLSTPLAPVSPYAISKVALMYTATYYRKVWGLKVYDFITFNHESELRGEEFVTMKIVKNLVEKGYVRLGNIKAEKDWGYAGEYVKIFNKVMEGEEPKRYILCTGVIASVEDFLNYVMQKVGGTYEIDPSLFRPLDAEEMVCDVSEVPIKPRYTWRDVADIMIKYVKDGIPTFPEVLGKV
jgi:GDPmannose 4,6-dehydratase